MRIRQRQLIATCSKALLLGGSLAVQCILLANTASAQFSTGINLSVLNGTTGFRFDGPNASDQVSLASFAGDFNADGIDDIVIGAGGDATNGAAAGACYVVFGRTSSFRSPMQASELNGSSGFKILGASAGDATCRDAHGAGDVNGDGVDDLIIGASDANAPLSNSGAAYVVFGGTSGFGSVLQLTSLDGTNGFKLSGFTQGENAGLAVNSAGDINGDGFDDVLVGAPEVDDFPETPKVQRIWFSAARPLPQSALGAMAADSGFIMSRLAPSINSQFGRSVASGGDINGDGFDDMVVGAPLTLAAIGEDPSFAALFRQEHTLRADH